MLQEFLQDKGVPLGSQPQLRKSWQDRGERLKTQGDNRAALLYCLHDLWPLPPGEPAECFELAA